MPERAHPSFGLVSGTRTRYGLAAPFDFDLVSICLVHNSAFADVTLVINSETKNYAFKRIMGSDNIGIIEPPQNLPTAIESTGILIHPLAHAVAALATTHDLDGTHSIEATERGPCIVSIRKDGNVETVRFAAKLIGEDVDAKALTFRVERVDGCHLDEVTYNRVSLAIECFATAQEFIRRHLKQELEGVWDPKLGR
jgi:hypothetical protein